MPCSPLVNSAFHPAGVGKLSTGLLAGVMAGCIHLCRMADNPICQVTPRSSRTGISLGFYSALTFNLLTASIAEYAASYGTYMVDELRIYLCTVVSSLQTHRSVHSSLLPAVASSLGIAACRMSCCHQEMQMRWTCLSCAECTSV